MPEFYTVVANRVDAAFTTQETRNFGLSLQFNDFHIAYCVMDYRLNKYILLHEFRRNDFIPRAKPGFKLSFEDFLRSVLTANPWLKNPFKSVRIAYEGKKSTLIPGPLFDAQEAENFLKLTYPVPADEHVLADHIQQFDNYNVYSIPKSLEESLMRLFPSARISSLSTILLQTVWMNFKTRINANRIFLHIKEKSFDILIYNGKQIKYLNTFTWMVAEDVAYFLIFVLEQLGMNPEQSSVVLLGNIDRGSNLFELIYRYVKNMEFGRRNETYKYSPVFDIVAPQSYYPLLNFNSCES
ncbi:MAG: DUF3822 family protein [Bacteroidetes bacterium]|jgi:Protein of unknown function (DUF3822)|nr:DUF3822 family protein [Bacteroidota bacterium]